MDVYVRPYVCMYVCMYVCTYVCVCTSTYVYMYECMYVCMCVCMYMFMYICILCMYKQHTRSWTNEELFVLRRKWWPFYHHQKTRRLVNLGWSRKLHRVI